MQKADKEEKKLAMRRKKDQAAAAKKSEAVHKEKMERLAARTQNNLKKLDKMRKTEFVLARKRKAAESDTSAPKGSKKDDKSRNVEPAKRRAKKGPSVVDEVRNKIIFP